MKIECYCYTRGEQPDYRDFCIPNNVERDFISILHDMVAPIFKQKLDTPRWVLYKHQRVVVWGICCNNELLSDSYNVDVKGRLVRGFFAFIFSDVDVCNFGLPTFDISVFQDLYEKEVAPYWFCQEGEFHYSQIHSIKYDDGSRIFPKHNEYSEALNTDISLCKSLGNGDRQNVVAAALSLPEISLLIDNVDMSEAIGKKGAFMNCLSSKVAPKTVKVGRVCPQCHKLVDELIEEGVCSNCEANNKSKKPDNVVPDENINQNEMEQKDKQKLEKELRNCKYQIEKKNKALSIARRTNKILLMICAVLLLGAAYLWHESECEADDSPENEAGTGTQTGIVSDNGEEMSDPRYHIQLITKNIEVPAAGMDSVVIAWKSNLPRVKTNIDKIAWIKQQTEEASFIMLSFEKNNTNEERNAVIEVAFGEQKEIVKIKQAAP